jgi:FkbM family methyltransferase
MNLSLITKYFTPTHILDIGGHTGEFFQLSKHFFPNCSVFIIEGNQSCEPYLQQLNTNFLIRVLGSSKKMTTFFKTKQNSLSTGNSIYREVTPHFSDEEIIEELVQQYTIDTTFQEANFDLIKLDTQGSEIDILKGGERIARQAKGILMEVSLEKYNEGSPLYNEVVEFMLNYGFSEKETLSEFNSITEYGLKVHQKDILFINNNLQ